MRATRPFLILAAGCLLALFSAALSHAAPPAMPGAFNGAAVLFAQSTATPPSDDLSEIGSTDAIVIAGVLIAVIVVIPILLQRKSWMEPR